MSMKGIDISHWQQGINLAAVDCDFVIIKATQGTKYVDPCFQKFCAQAMSLGKKIGLYHYYGSGEPEAQAEHFLQTVRSYIGKAVLVLDWEVDQNPDFKKGPALPKRFLDYVLAKTGVHPLIYMSKSVCREYNWTEVVKGNYGLWMAQYANKKPTGYQDKPWTDQKGLGAFNGYAIHQYSSAGRLPGYGGSLDLDIAYMTPAAWDKYAKADPKLIKGKRPVLRKGSRGEEVRELQESLTACGYSCGSIDGIFGKKTLEAVMAFQADRGLTVDGVAGEKTWNELNK